MLKQGSVSVLMVGTAGNVRKFVHKEDLEVTVCPDVSVKTGLSVIL